ncbi:MAG: DUF1361 domain-containing protein [Flavobacteriaceae bacterium]
MNIKYLYIFLVTFVLEIFILFTGGFVRHNVGDFVVVVLLYSLVRFFTKLSVKKAVLLVLTFSFIIELLQLLKLSSNYPSQFKPVLNSILGTTFSVKDLVAYTLGALFILITEHKLKNKQLFKKISKIEKLLFKAALISFLLLGMRLIIFESIFLSFLAWNLILAVVPYLISLEIKARSQKKISRSILIVWIISWMLFLPNAPYIITDFIHLQNEKSISLLFDLIVISSYAIIGLTLGVLSINNIYSVIASNWSKKTANIHLVFTVFLCGYGIYLGRILRFNSWSIFTSPLRLTKKVFYSFNDLDTWLITLGFGCLLWFLSYLGRNYSTPST